MIHKVMEYVDGYHYLDDVRFARNYVDYKGGRKSRRELAYELRGKGIDLNTVSADESLELPDDKETIRSILFKTLGNRYGAGSERKKSG